MKRHTNSSLNSNSSNKRMWIRKSIRTLHSLSHSTSLILSNNTSSPNRNNRNRNSNSNLNRNSINRNRSNRNSSRSTLIHLPPLPQLPPSAR